MRFRSKYFSASENGDDCQIAFENTDPADDEADVDGRTALIYRFSANSKAQMVGDSSANAGIQVRSRSEYKKHLDSGMRRNDGNRSQLPVDKLRAQRLGAEGCSVANLRLGCFFLQLNLLSNEVSLRVRKWINR